MPAAKFSSAGVYAREIDLSGPRTLEPVGIPAGVVGTANKGPAFVPVTVGIDDDFYAKFGKTDGKKFGPLAVAEWLRNARAVTYLRVLGIGKGERRTQTGNNTGRVENAGFVVGDEQPNDVGSLASNPYANYGGELGRLYFLGALMSESAGSTYLSEAGVQGRNSSATSLTASAPIVRGVLMAASGVLLRLSASYNTGFSSAAPASTQLGLSTVAKGDVYGAVRLFQAAQAKQEFVMILNGHKGTDPLYPNVVTASFDVTAPNYFPNVLNTDPYKLNQAGHLLYAGYDVHSSQAVVSGVGYISNAYSAGGGLALGVETAAFLTVGSAARNVGSSTVPSYENWEDRYSAGRSPWIVTQKFGGVVRNLFRLWMIDDGAGTTNKVKVSIENLAPSTDPSNKYGTFDVIVRDFEDRDTDSKILEQFRGVNLDPMSDKYIAKVVGDQHAFFDLEHVADAQKLVIDGDYSNRSNFIRVEVSEQVSTSEMDPEALPMGFRGHLHLVTSGSAPLATVTSSQTDVVDISALKRAVQPPVPMRQTIAGGSGATKVVNSSFYWGVQFEQVTSLTTPNASSAKNKSVANLTKYFPEFQTTYPNVVAGDNAGAQDTAALGVVDSDRFNYNAFSLENIMVVTNSAGYADAAQWVQAQYVRNGSIGVNDSNKTRAFSVSDLTQQSNRRFAKFSLFLQGGFDGVRIFDQDTAEMSNLAVTEEMNNTNRGLTDGPTVRSYKKAVDIMQNTTDVDIKLFAMPGLRHPIITDYATDAIQDRFDALMIMDIEEHDTQDMLVTSSLQLPNVQFTANNFADRALNTSFAAAYYPDVVMVDPNTETNVTVPPSVVVLGALALNDALAHPWFAPAGFARGALATSLETKVKLSKENMDALYEVDINPLVAFPGSSPTGASPTPGGVVVWGQKTLLQAASALDRVNVRRLLIEVRRLVRQVANKTTFEPNREATLTKFSADINPRLAKIQAQGGLDRFKVIVDTTTTTQNDIDNNTVRGRIYVQPTKSIEFVSLDFVVASAGGGVAG